MPAKNLCTADDVADMWRPLIDDAERSKVERLIGKASSLLRQKLPSVDTRIATFATLPGDVSALDPDTVAAVVATIVKRFLSNPDGATHVSKSLGGASVSSGYALRGDKDVRGELIVTDDDLAKLEAPVSSKPWLRTITTKHRMAPNPALDSVNDEFLGGDVGGYNSPPDTWLGVLP
jgi:hypothetical protein